MEVRELIRKNFDQMWGTVDRGLDGLTPAELALQPRPHCNSIGWIAWHMARVEDYWIHTSFANSPQLWEKGWGEKMGLPPQPRYTGASMTSEDIASFAVPEKDLLSGYAQAVRKDTLACIERLTPAEIDRPIDTALGRRMTVGEIFSHLFCEMNQHAGQISYLRGYIRGYQGKRV